VEKELLIVGRKVSEVLTDGSEDDLGCHARSDHREGGSPFNDLIVQGGKKKDGVRAAQELSLQFIKSSSKMHDPHCMAKGSPNAIWFRAEQLVGNVNQEFQNPSEGEKKTNGRRPAGRTIRLWSLTEGGTAEGRWQFRLRAGRKKDPSLHRTIEDALGGRKFLPKLG